MAANNIQNLNDNSKIKDPDEWVTGAEPMTGAQESYLQTLAREAGEEVKPDLTKAEASKKIEALQEETGRGTANNARSGARRSRRKKVGGS